MNYRDRYDGFDSSVTVGKENIESLATILLIFIVGILLLVGNIANIKEYNEAKKSGDWVVCEARYVTSTCKEVENSEGDKSKIYTLYFEYEAPDGNKYEHVEKSRKKAKNRDTYELIAEKDRYWKSRMKPFEACGVDATFILGIIILFLPVPILIKLFFEWKAIPDWRSKYDL